MVDIRLRVDAHELTATWNAETPTTRRAIADALPLEGAATRWGDELYFRTDVDVPPEEPRTAVPVGTLAYWPVGNAVCLFWGATPASVDDEPRGAAPVNVVATVDDVTPLHSVAGDARMRIESP